MEFINVRYEGKDPFDSQRELGVLMVMPLSSVESVRFLFDKEKSVPKKKKLSPHAYPVDFESVIGGEVKTTTGCLYELSVGTARRLYTKICNNGLSI